MSSMAKYARIFRLEPTDEFVAKRKRAAQQIGETFASLPTPFQGLELASQLAEGIHSKQVPDELARLVVPAISKESESFIRAEEDLQILICAMVAALDKIPTVTESHGWTALDALAAGLWSSLSLQPPQEKQLIEDLRANLLRASHARVMRIAELSRRRADVPEVGNLSIPEAAADGTRASNAFKNATRPLVAALQKNAELDREEIDLLWWVMSDFSDILQRPLFEFEGVARAVVTGIDSAAKLRKLPADSHRNLVLRNVDRTGASSLADVVAALEAHREALTKELREATARAPGALPLLRALHSGKADGPSAQVQLTSRDWGARALLEASIIAVSRRLV
jgi:hypothetical protein